MSFAAALPLLAHLPPRGEALSAQRANLVRFVEEEAEAFAELPYLPWTEEFFVLDAPPVVVLPAKVAVGLHGVFLTRPLVTDARSKVLMYYPGVLMTDSLFSRFHARFHCPTALRVPALDFYRQDTRSAGRGRKECITLVGDPTAPGAVVNDGAYAATPEQAHQRVNCELTSASLAVVQYAQRRDAKSGKLRVSAEVATVAALPQRSIAPADELLVDYGPDFWTLDAQDEHCAHCFGKDNSALNPLVLCEGVQRSGAEGAAGVSAPCPVGRHRLCFPQHLRPSLLQLAHTHTRFYCPEHMAAAALQLPLAGGGFSRSHRGSADEPAALPARQTQLCQEAGSDMACCEGSFAPRRPAAGAQRIHTAFAVGPSLRTPSPAAAAAAARGSGAAQAGSYGFGSSPMGALLPSFAVASPAPLAPRRLLYDRSGTAAAAAQPVLRPPAPAAVASMQHTSPHRSQSFVDDACCSAFGSSPWGKGLPAAHASDASLPAPAAAPLRRALSFDPAATGSVVASLHQNDMDGSDLTGGDSWIQHVEWEQQLEQQQLEQVRAPSPEPSFFDANAFYSDEDAACVRGNHDKDEECPTDSDSDSEHSSSSDSSDEDGPEARRRAGGAQQGRRLQALPPTGGATLSARVVSCRTVDAARKLAGYAEAASEFGLTEAHLRAELRECAGAWFAREGKLTAVPAAVPTASLSERWRSLVDLKHDWSEYRACCGTSAADRSVAATGSWASAMGMFRARLKQQGGSCRKSDYICSVRDLLFLHTAAHDKVHYMGQQLCDSCFRAAVGFGRTKMYSLRNYQSAAERRARSVAHAQRPSDAASGAAAPPQLTAAGQPSFPRAQRQRQMVMQLLKAHADPVSGVGQVLPNQQSDKYERRIVPSTSVPELCVEVAKSLPPGPVTRIAPATMIRAIKLLRQKHGISVSTARSKEMAQCDTCSKCQNALSLARNDLLAARGRLNALMLRGQGTDEERADAASSVEAAHKSVVEQTMLKARHLREVLIQRDEFHAQRDLALNLGSVPRRFCLMFDGMDQAKTRLPLLVRDPKGLEKLLRLGVHAVGAVNYGAPLPVMGLLNLPDVRKDSSLTVTIIERILDMQWQELLQRQQAKSAAAASAAAAAAAAEPREAPSSAYSGVGDAWPAWLQIWFDNAAGENKNQWVFRFLGLLVLHGVFQAVTVSTLIVGHTHGIVDQMFSVWSRLLRSDNVLTFEDMCHRFQDKYTSRIEALSDLMKGISITAERAQELGFDADALERLQDLQQQSRDRSKSTSDTMDDLTELAKRLKLAPVVRRQASAIDVQGWMDRMARAQPGLKGPHLDNLTPAQIKRITKAVTEGGAIEDIYRLTGLLNPHMFAIEKDEHGDVYLYNKLHANATSAQHAGVVHHYPNQLTGSWTTRALLWRAADAQVSAAIVPSNLPALPIDTDLLTKTIDAFKEHKYFDDTSREAQLWDALLKRVKARAQDEGQACATCAQLLKDLHAIGVVSRGANMSEQQHADALAKERLRRKAQAALTAHLSNPAASAQHSVLSNESFLTKWIDRVRHHIRPSYISRGTISNETDLQVPFTLHPLVLCAGEGEEPIYESDTRVPMQWQVQHGLPQVGQLVVARMQSPSEPFYIGQILLLDDHEQLEAAPAAAVAVAAGVQEESSPVSSGPQQMPHRGDRRKGRLELQPMPRRVHVRWWDISKKDGQRLRLNARSHADVKHWQQLWKQHTNMSAEEWSAQRDGSVEAVPPSLDWVVSLYQRVVWVELTASAAEETCVSGEELIVWGSADLLLNKPSANQQWGRSVKAAVWDKIHADLTEQRSGARVRPAAQQPPAAAAAAAEEQLLPLPAAAAAAAAPLPAPAAKRKRKTSTQVRRAVPQPVLSTPQPARQQRSCTATARLKIQAQLSAGGLEPFEGEKEAAEVEEEEEEQQASSCVPLRSVKRGKTGRELSAAASAAAPLPHAAAAAAEQGHSHLPAHNQHNYQQPSTPSRLPVPAAPRTRAATGQAPA